MPVDQTHTKNMQHEAGFTLFELLIVMAMVAFASGAVLMLYRPGTSSSDLKAMTRLTASKLKLTRTTAITKQSDAIVLFNINTNIIEIPGPRENQYQIITLNPNLKISVIAAESERRSPSIIGIRFFPNGSSTGGAIKLNQENQSYEVRVNWLTGRVSTTLSPQG